MLRRRGGAGMLRRRHGGRQRTVMDEGLGVGQLGVAQEAEAEAEAEEKKGIAACFEMEASYICRLAYLLAGEVDELCLSSVSPVRPTTER